jgi:uncharacterized protein YecT (DUF1311 family)
MLKGKKMKPTLTILILLFLFSDIKVYSQNKVPTSPQQSQSNEKYNFDKDCGDGGQQDINYCLSEAEKKLIKILQIKYECLIAYFDKEIKEYSSSVKDRSILVDLKQEKQFLISSQIAWRKLADENASFWGLGGGTQMPMYVAESLIKDTKDRLKWLDNVIEEGQGPVNEVLNCE